MKGVNMSLVYDKESFGKRFSELRKKRWEQYKEFQNKATNPYSRYVYCKSQDTFAEKVGHERRTIGKWELGTAVPSFEDVLKICNLLECNIDYLLGKEDLTGFSTIALAAHYSKIDAEIIEYAQKDNEYYDFLNHFMKPSNCYELIKLISLSEWKSFLSNSNINEINGDLEKNIENIFQQYLAFTPINQYNMDSFKKYITAKLSKEDISFKPQKLNDKIYIPACISPSRYKALGFSDNETENYNILIDYLSEYCFEILLNRTMLEIQRDKIGKTFVQMITNYYSTDM